MDDQETIRASSSSAKPLPLEVEPSNRSTPLLAAVSPSASSITRNKLKKLQWRFRQWVHESAWPGMGLFGESYLLFSIGTLRPVWDMLYPDCFSGDECSPDLLSALSYSVVLGVICGMLVLGTLANSVGRRIGSITTATFMAAGAVGLTASSIILSQNASALFGSMTFFLCVFGFGVGGEYPLSASSASERAMGELKRRTDADNTEKQQGNNNKPSEYSPPVANNDDDGAESMPRGRRVLLVFTMQGMGIFLNSLSLTFFLLITGQLGRSDNGVEDPGNDDVDAVVEGTYNPRIVLAIWQLVYAIGAAILVYVLQSRVRHLKESQVWADDRQRREGLERLQKFHELSKLPPLEEEEEAEEEQQGVVRNVSTVSSLSEATGLDHIHHDDVLKPIPSTDAHEDLKSSETYLLMRNYGWRLFGTSMSWLLWDVAFYGNKLFQSSFLIALTGKQTTLFEVSAASTLNATIALLGYFAAAFIVDNKHVGRLRLQQYGFLITGSLFVACGIFYNQLPVGWLVVMYFGSSFFGQCGPNATTFLIPAEIFPTEMRTMCHGISAASGKLGALLAAILFNFVAEVDLFLISGYCSFAASLVTFLTIPETTSLDLYELDRKWRMILDGRKAEYEGPANDPAYLSYFERRKVGLHY